MAGLPSAHVHGVAVNPADERVYLATHDGLFRYDDTGPVRIGPVIDLMGFTVAGPDPFYASGHPGPGTDLPEPVGLIESTTAGRPGLRCPGTASRTSTPWPPLQRGSSGSTAPPCAPPPTARPGGSSTLRWRALRAPFGGAGTLLAPGGVVLDVAGLRRFAGPAQVTGTAAGDVVTGGIYRYSRHPQYAGIVATLTGLALLRRSAVALALTAGLTAIYRAWVPVEEEHLTRHFGEPYRHYQNATPRWLGLPAPRPCGAAQQRLTRGEA